MQAATHSPLYVSDERACIIIHLDSCKASSFRELSLNCLIQPWVADAMEEVSPAHSRTSKYASFSPSRKEEDQTKVGTVEITYVDPVSQTLSNMDVFLDPDSWSGKANEMRFLISADLVNLVSESHAARQARFRTREHSTLRLEPTTPLMLMCDTSHDAQSGVDMWHCQVSTTPQSEILFLILTSNKSQNCFLSLQHLGIVPPQPIQWLQLCNSDQLHIFSFPAIGKRRRDWSKRAWFFLWTFGNSGGWLSEWHWQLMNLKVLQVSPQRHATFISLWLSYVWDLGIPLFVCVCTPPPSEMHVGSFWMILDLLWFSFFVMDVVAVVDVAPRCDSETDKPCLTYLEMSASRYCLKWSISPFHLCIGITVFLGNRSGFLTFKIILHCLKWSCTVPNKPILHEGVLLHSIQVPELYFDDHTLECLKRASDVFLKHLLDEMRALQERLALWQQFSNVSCSSDAQGIKH